MSNIKLALSGFLMVNLPITIIMILSMYFLTEITHFKFTEKLIISFALGWIFWEFASRYWIKWALLRKVDKQQLLKVGIRSLVLWKSDFKKIENIDSKLKNQNR